MFQRATLQGVFAGLHVRAFNSKVTSKVPESFAPLPILPRPLGVPNPPTAGGPTWQERRDELLNRERHLEKRKLLIKEATTGYFEDFHKTMRGGHGGKLWLGPRAMIREDRALYLPDISGRNLRNQVVCTTEICQGSISIVAILPTRAAEEHINTFAENVWEAYRRRGKFNFVQINLQENPLKYAVATLSRFSLRRSLPEELHATYFHSSQNMEMLRVPMGLGNKHIGFVYLVDQDVRIRWAGCGYAKDEERDALLTCTGVLLDRLDKQ